MKKIKIFFISLLFILSSTLSNATTVGAWTLSNPMAVGASILYDGLKGAVKSSVLITPNAAQVAKVLKGGVAGIALQLAVEQLLGAVDWVLDPANNQITYKVPISDPYSPLNPYIFSVSEHTSTNATSAIEACKLKMQYYQESSDRFNWKETYISSRIAIPSSGSWYFDCFVTSIYNPTGVITESSALQGQRRNNNAYNPSAEVQTKNIPLETVAQKVIENAENNNLDAQFTVLAAATNILSEAENDDAKAKPIEDELERNSEKCPNGESRNIYGQCWICPAAEKQPIESNKNIAKVRAQALGSCVTGGRNTVFKNYDKDEFLVRATAWDALAEAREIENMCWLPAHQNHVQEAQTNRKIAETCRAGAAQAIK